MIADVIGRADTHHLARDTDTLAIIREIRRVRRGDHARHAILDIIRQHIAVRASRARCVTARHIPIRVITEIITACLHYRVFMLRVIRVRRRRALFHARLHVADGSVGP